MDAAPFAIGTTGIVVIQALLLWRIRAVEREQHYLGQMLHWTNNVLTVVAAKLDIDLSPRPTRLPP